MVIVVMIKSMLIQRLEKSRIEVIALIWARDVFALDLCTSRKSMLFLVLVIMSLKCCCSTMHTFLQGRKADGLMEFTLLLRLVTLSVAKFQLSICAAKVLQTIWMERYLNQMLRWSCSLVISRVWQIRPARVVDRAVHG
jgi:hypothetical protein